MKEKNLISGDVRISGVINDEEFTASGNASGNPDTGEFQVMLNYENIPKGWHPFMYVDIKASLLFLREEAKGQNFLSLNGGVYRSAGTIQFGDGNILHNHTNIRMLNDRKFTAVYYMQGTAHTGRILGLEYFEETMLPMGNGNIAALAIAKWKSENQKPLTAMLATRYIFDEKKSLKQPQFRRIEAKPKLDKNVFSCTYIGYVKPLPRVVEKGGAYIGHLIG